MGTVMTGELERDQGIAKGRTAKREGLQYSVSRKALMNAVRSEGREILTEKGEEYWRDQERKYPHLRTARTDTGENLAGTRNRWGRVSWRSRFVDGRLVRERNVGGRWVEMERRPEDSRLVL